MTTFLKCENLVMQFGGLTAVNEFSLTLEPGALVGLIGPNGAGKTTVFNMITGSYIPSSGSIFWKGENVTRLPVHQITARGIARTFQNIRLFGNMSVLENVLVSMHHKIRSRFWEAMFSLPGYRREEADMHRQAMDFLHELGLAHLADEPASSLPYGRQRRLEIARGLATRPQLLLLDEPAAGMNPQETRELSQLLRQLRDKYGVTIFLIEHDMKFVMGLCEHIKVLDYGVTIAEGTPAQVQCHPAVIKAYLGDKKHAYCE